MIIYFSLSLFVSKSLFLIDCLPLNSVSRLSQFSLMYNMFPELMFSSSIATWRQKVIIELICVFNFFILSDYLIFTSKSFNQKINYCDILYINNWKDCFVTLTSIKINTLIKGLLRLQKNNSNVVFFYHTWS